MAHRVGSNSEIVFTCLPPELLLGEGLAVTFPIISFLYGRIIKLCKKMIVLTTY